MTIATHPTKIADKDLRPPLAVERSLSPGSSLTPLADSCVDRDLDIIEASGRLGSFPAHFTIRVCRMSALPARISSASRGALAGVCTLWLAVIGLAVGFPVEMLRRAAAEETPAKRAVLIGINTYDHSKLTALRFAEADATEMATVLKRLGYTVELVTGSKATKANVDATIKRVIDGCKKGDTVLVGLAGHGLQFRGQKDCFFVPVDGKPFENTRDSLVSLSGVYTRLDESFAGIKVLLVDACRDDPNGSRGIDADTAPRPPQGVAALFSCKAGERAFEHDRLKHGVFFHYVLQGLNGEAVDKEGDVTFASLASYVTKNVSRAVPQLISGAKQSPNMKADYSAEPVLAKLDLKPVAPVKPTLPMPTPKPATPSPTPTPAVPSPVPSGSDVSEGKAAGELREFGTHKIKMVWCPPGTFTMGSPVSEAGRDPDEEQVEVTLSDGFWLGQTELTQGQWEAVMKTTPWKDKARGKTSTKAKEKEKINLGFVIKEGPAFPAMLIEHGGTSEGEIEPNSALDFCEKLTVAERTAGRLPMGWRYRLPTEAEWEYACRAGSKTAYSFGDEESRLNDYAWWGGFNNVGNATTERYAHQVGLKRANNWGLFDMHGNVWELCHDLYAHKLAPGRDPFGPAEGAYHVLRGGSWNQDATSCRSAERSVEDALLRFDQAGFRLACAPESKSPPKRRNPKRRSNGK